MWSSRKRWNSKQKKNTQNKPHKAATRKKRDEDMKCCLVTIKSDNKRLPNGFMNYRTSKEIMISDLFLPTYQIDKKNH